MSYEERLEIVEWSLIKHCKDCIIKNHEQMFDMWLECEADMAFGYGYQNKFKEQFEKYMNPEINSQLFFAGTNLLYAIRAFISFKQDYELDELLDFTEKFIEQQIGEFDNWCEDISSAIYEETSEYERENNKA